MQFKITPSAVNRITIEKKPDDEFSVTVETDGKKSYYEGYNKINENITVKGEFTATKIEDIITYVKERKEE